MRTLGLFVVLAVAVSGCSYPISRQLRAEVTRDVTFPMVLTSPSAYVGDIVLWGGSIIKTVVTREGTDIFVLDNPLDYWEEPEADRYSRGRFIAKSSKFLDPEVYRKGRRITLAGEVLGGETLSLDQADYTYPVVAIKQLHLWKKVRYYPYYPYSYWGWGAPYYGPLYGPGYGYDYGEDEEHEGRHDGEESEERHHRD